MCVQTHAPESLRLLRKEAPRKTSTGGREGACKAGVSSTYEDQEDVEDMDFKFLRHDFYGSCLYKSSLMKHPRLHFRVPYLSKGTLQSKQQQQMLNAKG